MTTLVELKIETPQDRSGAAEALSTAKALPVTTNDEYQSAAESLLAVKGRWKAVEEQRKVLVAPIDEARKRVMDLFRSPLALLAEAEGVLKGKIAAYQDEQDRLRREEQRKADEQARKERERLEREARAAEEASRAKAAEQRRLAEEAEAAGRAEEAAKLEAAAAATEQKAAAKVERLAAAAEQVVAPIVDREAPKVAGVSSRETWAYEITDVSQIPREFMVPNDKRIGQVVKAMKADTNIPGVRAYRERNIAGRA